jgi:hypothetical protein
VFNRLEGMQTAIDEALLTPWRTISSQNVNEPDMSVHRIAQESTVCDLMIDRSCTWGDKVAGKWELSRLRNSRIWKGRRVESIEFRVSRVYNYNVSVQARGA